MMLYNYDNLLNAVREIKTNKTIAENERTMNKRNKLLRLENELKSSGILDDWYDLKRLAENLMYELCLMVDGTKANLENLWKIMNISRITVHFHSV